MNSLCHVLKMVSLQSRLAVLVAAVVARQVEAVHVVLDVDNFEEGELGTHPVLIKLSSSKPGGLIGVCDA
jgi:hypothetical protein